MLSGYGECLIGNFFSGLKYIEKYMWVYSYFESWVGYIFKFVSFMVEKIGSIFVYDDFFWF